MRNLILAMLLVLAVSACAGRQRLSGQEIAAAYMPSKVTYTCGAVRGKAIRQADGVGLLEQEGLEDTGKFWIKGDLWCFTFPIATNDVEYCSNVYRVGENQFREESVTPNAGTKCDVTVIGK